MHTPTNERAGDPLPLHLPLSRRLLAWNNGELPPSREEPAFAAAAGACVCLQGATVITPRASGESAPAAAAAC